MKLFNTVYNENKTKVMNYKIKGGGGDRGPHIGYLCFFSSIRVDPGPYIVTSPENTYLSGKHGEIKVHRSNACDMSWVRARLCKLQKGCTRLAAASDKVYQLKQNR